MAESSHDKPPNEECSEDAPDSAFQVVSGGGFASGFATVASGADGKRRLPAYVRIVQTITERIASGSYEPEGRLPSESQLCREFDVSPMTIRRALSTLAGQGFIRGEQGRGTFVRSPTFTDSVFRLEELSQRLLNARTKILLLSASSTEAGEDAASRLSIDLGSQVIRLRRLVLEDDRPIMYHVEYVLYDPRRPLVESQLKLTSPDGLLESERGFALPRGEIGLRAVSLDEESAQVLREAAGAPALRLEHVSRDASGQPVGWGQFFLHADLCQFRSVLGPE